MTVTPIFKFQCRIELRSIFFFEVRPFMSINRQKVKATTDAWNLFPLYRPTCFLFFFCLGGGGYVGQYENVETLIIDSLHFLKL